MLSLSDVWTIAQLKQYNRERGRYFFSPATMKFFTSRVLPRSIHHVTDGIVFITSEADYSGQRREYALRLMIESGHVRTIGEHATLTDIRAALRQYTQEDAARYAASTAAASA
jgi:hypothetical protein